MKDYYEVMGISQDAKEEEIKLSPGVEWADDGILQKEGLREKGVQDVEVGDPAVGGRNRIGG